MSKARLILTCGLPGAGKTTLARGLAANRPAVRFTKDEWLWALGTSPWDRPMNIKVEQELWRLAQEVLTSGLSVVLDFGLWARVERDEMRTAARALGVGVELHYLRASTRAHLDEWTALFQAPDDGELALFDAPPESTDPRTGVGRV